MPLPNPGMSFTPFDPLPASDLNDLVENVEALADGSGFDNDSIPSSAIDFGGAGAGVWWEEIGRTTLASAGDAITITGLPVRKYLQIKLFVTSTGGTIALNLRFNNDSGGNYNYRASVNSNDDGVALSQTSVGISPSAIGAPSFAHIELVNVAAEEKVGTFEVVQTNAPGAANVQDRNEGAFKWANASSAISRVDLVNSGAGDFAIGSQVVVLGHD